MADTGRGQVSLAGLGLVSAGVLLVWTAINNPPQGPLGALKQFLETGQAQVGLIRSATNLAQGTSSGPGSVNTAEAGGDSRIVNRNGARIVQVAETYLGDPYLWGGSSHKGIDCSGLVLVAYRDGAGVALPHFATAQAAKGRAISADQVQAGDLVAWGVPGNYPHIAIAVDQSTCIAAWTYGVGVTEQPIHQRAIAGFGYPDFYRIL